VSIDDDGGGWWERALGGTVVAVGAVGSFSVLRGVNCAASGNRAALRSPRNVHAREGQINLPPLVPRQTMHSLVKKKKKISDSQAWMTG
jgi:hypothetical protein